MTETTKLLVGYPVESTTDLKKPNDCPYQGEFVSLTKVNPDHDLDELYEFSHGDVKTEQLWTYMPYGPFANKQSMLTHLKQQSESSDPLFFTVNDKQKNKKVGVVSFLSIDAANRHLELGHIWYSPLVQQSKVNTEAMYLMLCESFERLDYRRVEWKCNALNANSRAAAIRLGFSFEGIFYKHQINKNRNRDTAWFAMLNDDWPNIKDNMQKWLYGDHDYFSLSRANRPLIRRGDTGEAATIKDS